MNYLKRKFSWSEIESSQRLMLLIVIMLSTFNFIWGEKTPASNGFGWDGVMYGNLVRNIDTLISSGQLNNYYAHRSLPSFIVRFALQLFQIPMTDINIIKTFEVFNFVLVMFIFFIWNKIAKHFNLNLREHWIAFCGLFLSFSMAKLVLYLPLVTDVAALFIGVLLLYFYVKKKSVSIFLTAVFGAFCWPGVSIVGALLLIFLNIELSTKSINPDLAYSIIKGTSNKSMIKWGWALLIASVVLRSISKIVIPESRMGAFFTGLPPFYFVSLGMILLLGSFSFFTELWNHRNKVSYKLVALAAITLAVPSYLGKLISNPAIPNPNTPGLLVELIFFPPDNKFFLAPMTLSIFWGPTFLLMLIFWKEICIQIRRLGPGPMAVVALHLPLGLVCEPRFYTLIWPLLVIALVLSLQKVIFSPNFKKLFIVLAILFSKFWLIINIGVWSPGIYDGLLEFPKQFLFMHLGLWTSWSMYFLQLPLVIVCGYLLHKTVLEIKN